MGREMQEVKHKGRIVSIAPDVTEVEIIRSSACSACHARELCGFSEDEKKIVQVPTSGFDSYKVGDEVTLCMKRSMGMKAVWVAYVVPLVIMMVVILVLSRFPVGELSAGLGAIVSIALYYFIIWCLRDRLNNDFIFYIK